jgi:hemolysin III
MRAFTMSISQIRIPDYTKKEELLNSLTHGIGAVLGLLGLILMLNKAGTSLRIVCAWIYGISMIMLYTMSCLYHAMPRDSQIKKLFRVLDHCNVFLLVFGTYIPGVLIAVGGKLGWSLFSLVAVITSIGIILTLIDMDRFSKAAVACHLINGWSIIFGIPRLFRVMGTAGVLYIALGGVVYSIGAALYGMGKKKRYIHSVFHVFCVAATALQFIGLYFYLF